MMRRIKTLIMTKMKLFKTPTPWILLSPRMEEWLQKKMIQSILLFLLMLRMIKQMALRINLTVKIRRLIQHHQIRIMVILNKKLLFLMKLVIMV